MVLLGFSVSYDHLAFFFGFLDPKARGTIFLHVSNYLSVELANNPRKLEFLINTTVRTPNIACMILFKGLFLKNRETDTLLHYILYSL
jgi:hypothetical protein